MQLLLITENVKDLNKKILQVTLAVGALGRVCPLLFVSLDGVLDPFFCAMPEAASHHFLPRLPLFSRLEGGTCSLKSISSTHVE